MGTPAEDFVAHYSSQYYDPAKAHEYYMQNRELKGRQSTKGMSKTQNEAWSYAKNQIGEAKKAESQQLKDAEQQRLNQLRLKADAASKRIETKIRELADRLEKQRNTTVNPKLKRYLEGSHRALLQKARQSASAELSKVRTDLQSAIKKSRDDYSAATKQIDVKYDAAKDTEYKNIRSQLPGEAPKAPAKKRGRKQAQNGTKT